MKYFITPIAKIIWAVILTIIAIIVNIISSILFTIWHFKPYKGIAFEEEILVPYEEFSSPYAKLPKRGHGNVYNTYFHYIWGIKNNEKSW